MLCVVLYTFITIDIENLFLSYLKCLLGTKSYRVVAIVYQRMQQLCFLNLLKINAVVNPVRHLLQSFLFEIEIIIFL